MDDTVAKDDTDIIPLRDNSFESTTGKLFSNITLQKSI